MANTLPRSGLSFGPVGREVTLVDPKTLKDQCDDQGLPLEPWYRSRDVINRPPANSLVNPLGKGPARGMVLLTLKDLAAIDKEEFHNLNFQYEDVRFTAYDLQMTVAKAVDPGRKYDPNTCYYVEIVDRRHNFNRKMVGQRYNMVTMDGTDYQYGTTNGDDPWTWQELIEALWLASVGAYSPVPTLDPVPHGTPENFDFQQDYALDALCVVLDRLGLALRWTPWELNTPYDVVQIGKELDEADDLEASNAPEFIWDDYPLKATKTSVPAKVAVLFLAYPQDCASDRYCIVEVPRQPGSYDNEQRETDTVFITHDDMVARKRLGSGSGPNAVCGSTSESGCSGIIGCCDMINSTELHERACERAEDYYRMLTRAADPWQRIFSGFRKYRPLTRYKAIHWQEWGHAAKTTVFRGHDLLPPVGLWESWFKTIDLTCGGGSGGFGSGNVNFNFCSVVGPDCVMTLSSQVCCDSKNGQYAVPVYVVVVGGGIHFFVGEENRATAIAHATDNGLSGCIVGECPEGG